MPRKLKTFVTSIGFFEQAIAAPSMKAALETWGSATNRFHQGFAKETTDPTIVAATMAKPGVVLKRAVGSKGAFSENAQLPNTLPGRAPKEGTRQLPLPKRIKHKDEKVRRVISLSDQQKAKRTAEAYDRDQALREKEEARKAAVRKKLRERREAAERKAIAALENARQRHEKTMDDIARERQALDRREALEEVRWLKLKKKLQSSRYES